MFVLWAVGVRLFANVVAHRIIGGSDCLCVPCKQECMSSARDGCVKLASI